MMGRNVYLILASLSLLCPIKLLILIHRAEAKLALPHNAQGTNLVLGPPEKFYHRNPSGTFRDTHWYHLDNPKKVPGAPSKGFLIFLGFDRNITKTENWL